MRAAPLVVLELPHLAGGEDGDDTVPVLGLELLDALDEDEAHGAAGGVDVAHAVLQVNHAGVVVGFSGLVAGGFQEGACVGEANEGGGGGREENDGVDGARGLLLEGEGWVCGGCGGLVTGGFLGVYEDGGALAHTREVLGAAMLASSLGMVEWFLWKGADCSLHTTSFVPLRMEFRSPIFLSPA